VPGLVAVNWNGPPETLQTHSVRKNLRPGSLLRFFSVPFPQLRVLGFLTDHGVFDDGVAEVIHHCGDGEDAAQPIVQTFLRHGLLGLGVRIIHPRQSHRGGGQRQPCDRATSGNSVDEGCAIGQLLGDAAGISSSTMARAASTTCSAKPGMTP
jgi:hypothetical protein